MPKAKQLPRVHRYSLEFKLSAVRLSNMAGVQVQQVAEALDIHPFMLSRWRKQVREGRLCGKHVKLTAEHQAGERAQAAGSVTPTLRIAQRGA